MGPWSKCQPEGPRTRKPACKQKWEPEPLPFCGLSFVVPPVLTIPLRATRGLPFLVLPQLWQGLEWLDHPPGQGSLSVRAGTLAWQRRTLVVMDSGTIFTVLSACEIWCPDRLRARSGSARPCL